MWQEAGRGTPCPVLRCKVDAVNHVKAPSRPARMVDPAAGRFVNDKPGRVRACVRDALGITPAICPSGWSGGPLLFWHMGLRCARPTCARSDGDRCDTSPPCDARVREQQGPGSGNPVRSSPHNAAPLRITGALRRFDQGHEGFASVTLADEVTDCTVWQMTVSAPK